MPPCRKADLGQSHSTYCSRTRSLKADIRTLAFAQRRLTTRISDHLAGGRRQAKRARPTNAKAAGRLFNRPL